MGEFNPVLDIGWSERLSILVAEDEANIASLIKDGLSDYYDVILTPNGRTALQKVKWQKPAVILLDIMMPDMNGYEVVRALQSDPETATIPVLIMTARSFDDSTVQMIRNESNVRGFLNKPFRLDELRTKIKSILDGLDGF